MRLVGRPELIDEPWFATGAGPGRARRRARRGGRRLDRRAHPRRGHRRVREGGGGGRPDLRRTGRDGRPAVPGPRTPITTVEDPELGPLRMQNVLFRLSATPGAIRWAGRPHGADTDAVLTELGLTASRTSTALRDGGRPVTGRRLPLTWLYVPGDRPEVVAKALASRRRRGRSSTWRTRSPPTARRTPATATAELLSEPQPVPVHVRVNALDRPRGRADLGALAALPGLSGAPPAQGRRPRRDRPRRRRHGRRGGGASRCTPSWNRPSASSTPTRSPPPTRPCAASRSARRTCAPTWACATTRASTGPAPGWSSPRGRRASPRRPSRSTPTSATWTAWPPPAPTAAPWASWAGRPSTPASSRSSNAPTCPPREEIEAAGDDRQGGGRRSRAPRPCPDGRFIDAAVVAAAHRTLSLAPHGLTPVPHRT